MIHRLFPVDHRTELSGFTDIQWIAACQDGRFMAVWVGGLQISAYLGRKTQDIESKSTVSAQSRGLRKSSPLVGVGWPGIGCLCLAAILWRLSLGHRILRHGRAR